MEGAPPNMKSVLLTLLTSSQNADVVSAVSDGSVPLMFDTDVNAPAFAEWCALGADPSATLAYITVGTGIGGEVLASCCTRADVIAVGLVVNGSTVKGLLHPEGGHALCRRSADHALTYMLPSRLRQGQGRYV